MTRQLPSTRCIGHAISSVRNNIAYAFRISWPWYAVITLVGLGANFLAEYMTGGNVEANAGRVLPLYAVIAFMNILGFSSIAVNWHRYILLDEVPGAGDLFRLDDKVWRYFGNVLLIALILTVAGIVIIIPFSVLAGLMGASLPLLIAVLIILPIFAIVSYRLGIKLPAIALGRRDFLMRDAWAATRDNKLPIFLVALFQFLLGLAVLLALAVIVYALINVNEVLALVISAGIQIVATWVLSIFGITLLTSLYGFFVEGRDF
jgi:hypothetical protein